MLNFCQSWSEESRLQLNAEKSKVMAFYETKEMKKARKKPRRASGQTIYPAQFHIFHSFPKHAQRSAPLKEVQEFDYLGLRLDPFLTMNAALLSVKDKVNKSHALVAAVSYSLRYDQSKSDTTHVSLPRMLNLWKTCVLPHFLLYLRYFHNDKHIHKLQVALNQSLKATLRTSGHETAVLIETGIPPLEITRKLQLAQFRYRLSHSKPTSLSFRMWNLWQPYLHRMDETTIEWRMYLAVNHLDKVRIDIQAPMPTSVQQAKPHNKERSYKKFLQGISSEKWYNQLQLQAHNPASRLRTYVFLHLDDTRRMTLYKPAPYLSLCTAAYQLDLFRVRTQGCTDFIPSHMYYGKYTARAPYDQRYCPHCQPQKTLGDEIHVLSQCPTSLAAMTEFAKPMAGVFRLLDLPLFRKLDHIQQTRALLGNPPASLLRKNLKQWAKEAIPTSAEFARNLRYTLVGNQRHLIQITSDDESESSSDDDLIPLTPPPKFKIADTPTDSLWFVPQHPAGQNLVGRHFLYRWPKYGWCHGVITKSNTDPSLTIGKLKINFIALYPSDNSTSECALSLQNYNTLADHDSHPHTWLLIDPL